MDKKIAIVLSIVLFSLIGIIFLVSSMIPKESSVKEAQQESEETNQEEQVFDISSEVNSIKIIIEEDKTNELTYRHLYNNQQFLDKIVELKTAGASNIISNIDPENEKYCLSLNYNGSNFCVDNEFLGSVDVPNCREDNYTCVIEIIEQEDEPMEIIMPEEEQETQVVEEEKAEVLALEKDINVGSTNIKKYKNNNSGEETIVINGKEYGPYSESYITYDENDWGILCNYKQKWYVNINGKATGPYEGEPSIEFYGEDLGFSYVKNNAYYVNLKNKVYGPYSDLSEFNINN
ncbi:MAG: hypothetical protein PHY30_00380 [Candidatus Pacebacteria bacterium]|nr:hypothetical protein [Candidatus Paceibacterota bacterium]